MTNTSWQQKVDILKAQIEEQRSWGNNKVADLLAEDLQALLQDRSFSLN
jgi:hypothetical protein